MTVGEHECKALLARLRFLYKAVAVHFATLLAVVNSGVGPSAGLTTLQRSGDRRHEHCDFGPDVRRCRVDILTKWPLNGGVSLGIGT